MKKITARIFAGLMLLCAFSASAQISLFKNYNVMQYTDDNGLPQNSIKSISSDSQGFIWLATEDGLTRFDGRNFYIFNKSNLDVSSNRFYLILPTLDGVLTPGAVSRRDGNKTMYAVADGRQFVKIENGKATPDSLYYFIRNKNLLFPGGAKEQAFLSSKAPDYIIELASPIHSVIPVGYGKGNFYLNDSTSVAYYSNGKVQYKTAFRRNNGWNYFTMSGKLFYLNPDETVSAVSMGRVDKLALTGDILEHPSYKKEGKNIILYWNNASDQAYFYLDKNIYQLEQVGRDKFSTRLLVENFDLVSKNIQTIHLDKNNQTLFLGSITNGLFVLSRKPFMSLTAPGEQNVFYAQIEFSKNTVLTPTGTILGLDQQTHNPSYARLPVINKYNQSDERSILKDRNGYIWMKNGNSLFQFSPGGDQLIRSWRMNDGIKHIYQGSRNMIWLGMATTGLAGIDLSAPNPEPAIYAKNFKITYLMDRNDRELMIGTTEGLFSFDVPTRKISVIAGTESIYVQSIYVSNLKDVWITASEFGVMLVRDKKLFKFPLDAKRYLASPHCIVDDGRGFFWITTNKGLFQVAVKDLIAYTKLKRREKSGDGSGLYYNYFAKDQGFNTNEFNGGCQPCAVKLSNGFITLPSLNGLVWFRPGTVNTLIPDGNIILDNVEVNGNKISTLTDTLRLPKDPALTKLQFATPYFGDVYNLHLSYALVGEGRPVVARDWIPLKASELNINFMNLNAGKYTLLIRKSNGFGINNYNIKKLVLIIPPLWYQTWWAKLLFSIAFMAAVLGYIRFRFYRIEAENRRLEQKIARRTLDLEVSNKEVSRQLQMMSRLLTSMTHDIQSPLHYIVMMSQSIQDMVQRNDLEQVVETGNLISTASQGMSGLLKDLLDYIKANVYSKSLKFEDINLNALVESKLLIFKTIFDLKNNRLNNQIPDILIVYSDYQMLAIIIHNLVDNAAKFTQNGLINITAEIYGEDVILIISNNGIPLSQELLAMFNEDPKSANSTANIGRKAGLGFLIVKEIAGLIGVGLKVTQTETTNFQLTFKLS